MNPSALHRDERGIVGRYILGWLIIVAILGVAAIDGASIIFTTFRLADVAATAATDANAELRAADDEKAACEAAEATVQDQDPRARVVRCDIRRDEITITLREVASTVVAKRFDFLRKLTVVTRTETVRAAV